MALDRQQSARRLAPTGFLVAISVSLLVGIVGFGDSWREAIVSAIGTGIGSAIGIYLYQSAQRNTEMAE